MVMDDRDSGRRRRWVRLRVRNCHGVTPDGRVVDRDSGCRRRWVRLRVRSCHGVTPNGQYASPGGRIRERHGFSFSSVNGHKR
jgi:hypothetical protein